MTSEVIVMNKEAVAIAADSAATLTGEKIFKTNKIFTLSKYQPVGIMIYGSSQFIGIPWESVIKVYRKKLGKKKFKNLKDYCDDFIKFLETEKSVLLMNLDQRIENQINHFIYAFFSEIRERINQKITDKIEEEGQITLEKIQEITDRVINDFQNYCKEIGFPKSFSENDIQKLKTQHSGLVIKASEKVFEKLPINNKIDELSFIAFSGFIKLYIKDQMSGVVIVGFGENEIFPSYVEFITYGIINDSSRITGKDAKSINFETRASISAFAQGDVVETFMTGIAPDLRELYENTLPQIFDENHNKVVENLPIEESNKIDIDNKLKDINERLLKEFKKTVDIFKQDHFISPIMEIVAHLPKDELAEMAESLVNLTSFKRRVSTEMESVRGPFDVALISKGDGFIWVKRKHYFEPELNPQFQVNYFNEGIRSRRFWQWKNR